METQQDNSYEEINISELIAYLWASKGLIIFITILFAAGSVTYAINTPDKFTSTALLQVQSGAKSSSNNISQLGGIASLAGISISSGNSNKSYYAIETLKSRDFLKHINSFKEVAPNLVAAKGYDFYKKQTVFDETQYDAKMEKWIRAETKERKTVPSYLEVHENYMKHINITIDKKSGYLKIRFEHYSPEFSFSFINLLIDELNLVARQKDINESEMALEYLLNQLKTVEASNVKNSIGQLIDSQIERLMLANVREDYLVSTIDAPFIPEENSYPSRPMIAILGTLIGGILVLFYVLTRYYLDKRKR